MRLDPRDSPVHEAPFQAPAITRGESVRGAVAFILIGLEARIEADTVEQARMHLRRIGLAPLLLGQEKNCYGVFVHFGLSFEFQQRHRHVTLQPISRIDEMTHALERRAIVRQVVFRQSAMRIRRLQAP